MPRAITPCPSCVPCSSAFATSDSGAATVTSAGITQLIKATTNVGAGSILSAGCYPLVAGTVTVNGAAHKFHASSLQVPASTTGMSGGASHYFSATNRGDAGGSGGAITVQEMDGLTICTDITTLVFNGIDETVTCGGPGVAIINMTAYTYSEWDSSADINPCLPNNNSANWLVSAPTVEGTPFKIGDWTAGTSHPCVNGTYTIGHNNKCRGINGQPIVVNVYDADDTTLLATHTFGVTGNGAATVQNISIAITGWEADVDDFAGVVTISVDCDTILGSSSGRLYVTANVAARPQYTNTIFYDIDPNNCTVVDTPTIAETGGFVVTRFISGVEYYDLGSDFTVGLTDIDTPNGDAYRPSSIVEATGSEYGLPQLNLAPGDLVGWTNSHDDTDDSYIKTDWEITATSYYYLGTAANINARGRDPWSNQGQQPSANAAIAIDTYTTGSTRLSEGFRDEQWRCPIAGNFDLLNQRTWTSTNDLLVGDAAFWDGGAGRTTTDYTTYSPNAGSQPNYTTQNATVHLYREFKHSGAASAGFDINISGTYNTLEYKLAKAWDGTATGGTVWIDMTQAYNFAQWTNGNPASGGSSTGGNSHTFGTNNIVNTGDTMYIRVGFTGSQRITALDITFT